VAKRSANTFSFDVGGHGAVSAAVFRAPEPIDGTLVLAHGAGAPRTHPFMIAMASRIAARGVDVVTFNFPYAEAGRRMPDRPNVLEASWRAAIATVRARGGLPSERLFIGGKSMGGRIATHIAASSEGPPIDAVVLLGYPLHPLGKPKLVRREILDVRVPILVAQGTRDKLGTADEVARLLDGKARARVLPVAGGDHSFGIPGARSKDGAALQERVLDGVADAVVEFLRAPASRSRAKTRKRR
jgi:predicted alpha/beta-hydrolase family hydrolase